MTNQGFLKTGNPQQPAALFVPNHVAQQREVNHSTVKDYFRLQGFEPTHDFILIETLYDYRPPEDVTIEIPQDVKDRQQTSKVIAVGKGGRMPNGEMNKPCCEPGDLVWVAKGNYSVLKTDDAPGREFKLVHDSHIMGIFRQTPAKEPSTETLITH